MTTQHAGNRRVHMHEMLMEVCASTDHLIASAMRESWDEVLDGMDRRRRMMMELYRVSAAAPAKLDALESAVAESEKALWGVIAHSIVTTRNSDATSRLYR